jgi:putative transposase
MSRIQIKTGTRYVIHNDIHLIQKRLADHHYQIENLSTGETTILSHNALLRAWASGDLRFEITSPNARRDTDVPLNTRYQEDDLADLPDHIQEETWRRYHLVLDLYAFAGLTTFQMLPRSHIDAFIIAQGWQGRPFSGRSRIGEAVSAGSIERYLQAFVASGGDIRSLIPQTGQQGGRGKGRLHDRVEQIIEAVLDDFTHITERVSTVDQVVTAVVNRIADENRYRQTDDHLPLPSERTIRRRIKVAGERQILGRRLSRREQQAESDVQLGPRPTRILERVEIDHTTLDLFVVDETDGLPVGRPHITACIDKYSGLVPGWHIGFNHGGYESIMLCLQHAFLPKPDYRTLYGTEHDYPVYGLFEKLCIDHGKDFKSHDLQQALAELGVIREEMPSETPWFKGSIERYFQSINQQLLKGKPGYTFGDVVALGDYNAQKDAVISLSAFLEIFHIFMVDIYPHTWHRGLEAIPMQRWQANSDLYQPDLFEDATALKRILLPGAERTLRPHGIEWERNLYRGPEMARLRELHGSTKIRFKYNPDDMDVVYVRDRSNPTGWAVFHSTNPDYTRGLSLAKHRVIRQYINTQQQAVDRFSLARAKAHIQQVVDREFFTTRKLRRRSQLKPLLQDEHPPPEPRLVVLPPKSEPHHDFEDDFTADMTGWSADYDLPIRGHDNHD